MKLRSDTPSPRRPDDVNANKSLYGNERETPSIRWPESAGPSRSADGPGATDGASMTTDGPGREGGRCHVMNRGSARARVPVGHDGLGGCPRRKNPSASDIHPRNRTPAGNVSLGADDAVEGHRTGPGAIRNKEGEDGC